MRYVVIDFETDAIMARPKYPPRPVGVAICDLEGKKISNKRYLAWAHPTKNNSTKAAAIAELKRYYDDPDVQLIFHNSKFDVDVASVHLGLKVPPWQRIHDTLFLIYLDDPRAPSLSLKPTAERLLKMPPEERDAVREWLVASGVCRSNDKGWGAAIGLAPGDLVGRYAIGDVVRTAKLFCLLLPRITKAKMLQAYDRERELMPVLLDNESVGIRLDMPKLIADIKSYAATLEKIDKYLYKRLKKTFNVDSDAELADALDAADEVASWARTATGKRSTSWKLLDLKDKELEKLLRYRGALSTCLTTFMIPWREQGLVSGGHLHTNWNQVRGDNDKGTRTGRVSSNPNLQNIINIEGKEPPTKLRGLKLPPLPNVRSYIIADDDDSVIISLDYSQQELRALGHYEGGSLLQAYRDNPRMDIHDFAQTMINKMLGANFSRKPIKNMGFGLIYGMGKDKLAAQMGVDVDTSITIKRAYLTIFPGLKELNDDIKRRAALDQPIRTWGGRVYYCEPPRMVDGRMRTFDYKLLNVLIQGSSADCTKEAMIRHHRAKKRGRFLLQIHDQLVFSVPQRWLKQEVKIAQQAMESVEFDVAMLVDISVGHSLGVLFSLGDYLEQV